MVVVQESTRTREASPDSNLTIISFYAGVFKEQYFILFNRN